MKLYYARGSSSLGITILLEEIGVPCERVEVALMAGEHYQPAFTAISPKSRVPVLVRDDGSVLTEYGAIAHWLAGAHPQAGLLPQGLEEEARMVEAMDYCVGTVHMQGYMRAFVPQQFTPNKADHDAVRKRGRDIMAKGFAILDRALEGKDHIVGRYTLGDSAVFYVAQWGKVFQIPLPAHLARHNALMLARPAVQRALALEGLDQLGNKV